MASNPENMVVKMLVNTETESVRTYLTLIQGVISRMASNSASCKTWCITIVAALFALAIDKGKAEAILIGLFPVGLFFLLDAYYLSLEVDFRHIYNNFVEKLHNGSADNKDVYNLTPGNDCFLQRSIATLKQFLSFSIWPFYGIILATLLITYGKVQQVAPASAPRNAPTAASPPAGTDSK